MADQPATAPTRLRTPQIRFDRLRDDLLRRPMSTALVVLVFAVGLGAGLFAHQVIAGDHHATAIYDRAVDRGALTRNVYKHQNADLDAIRDAEQAQMRNDGIIKGLLMVAVLLLGAIAVTLVLSLSTTRKDPAS